ncbi:MAG: sigma-70 family RNA polymerase sigma factor [Planctomycetota bacterium]
MNTSSTGSGDEESLEEIFRDFSSQLRRIAWAICRDWGLAADAVQEAFLLLEKRWETIEPKNRRGWLVRTTQFQAQNLRRKKTRYQSSSDTQSLLDDTSAEEQLELNELADWFRQQIQQLPDSQKTVLEQRFGMERTFAEIAEDLDVPLGTVLSRFRLAMTKLRKLREE